LRTFLLALPKGLTAQIYFDNDQTAYAVRNALEFKELLA